MTENKQIREIVFDTETTGFAFGQGDRIVEIGALELINHIPTGKTFHYYINPERSIPEESTKIHKITDEMVKDSPKFADIADKWLEFIGEDAFLVAHNAAFDMNFINMELDRIGKKPISNDRVIDTLKIAQKKFPSNRNNLDALCNRFEISLAKREEEGHGALLDSEILTKVYIELIGAREMSFFEESEEITTDNENSLSIHKKITIEKRNFPLDEQEENKHKELLSKIENSIWNLE